MNQELKPIPGSYRKWGFASIIGCASQALIHVSSGAGWISIIVEHGIATILIFGSVTMLAHAALKLASGHFRWPFCGTLLVAVSCQIAFYSQRNALFFYGYQKYVDGSLRQVEPAMDALVEANRTDILNRSNMDRLRIVSPLLKGIPQRSEWRDFAAASGCGKNAISYCVVFHSWNRIWGSGFGCFEAFGTRLSEMTIKSIDSTHFIFSGPYHDQVL